MIIFEKLAIEEIQGAFQEVKDIVDISHRPFIFLGNLYKIRVIEAQELAQSLEEYGVRRITSSEVDYWTDSDSPLF